MTVGFFKKLNMLLCIILAGLLVLIFQDRAPSKLGIQSAPKVEHGKTY